MPIRIAIPKEIAADEQRVALVPAAINQFKNPHCQFFLQAGAGLGANYLDTDYQNVEVIADAARLYQEADIIVKVQTPTEAEIKLYKSDAIVVGFMNPNRYPERINLFRDKKITSFAMELIPRITRAQAMDALSSQAAVAGYKAALIAANTIHRFFPMLTTAAGTIKPVKAIVVGAGVAGLQAIATCRRLGAIVEAYDIRPEVKEQVQSLGAKMLDLNINASGTGGYARELTAEEKQKQQEILKEYVSKAEVIICTAAVPGRPAPKIITRTMVEAMKPGAVIIDMAAESGGNCELTEPGKSITHNNVIISGPLNLPSSLARDASDMYAKNISQFLQLIIKEDKISLDWQDEIIAKSILTHAGEIKGGTK